KSWWTSADKCGLTARGHKRVGRVRSAAGRRARSRNERNAGYFRGAATMLLPAPSEPCGQPGLGPIASLLVVGDEPASTPSSRLALGSNPGCAIPRDYDHGLLSTLPGSR